MYSTGGFSFKQSSQQNSLFLNPYTDSNSQHFIKHTRGVSYDSSKAPQFTNFNTPPKANFVHNNAKDVSEFFSESKFIPTHIFEERNKAYFSPQRFRNGQLISEIVDYMENKKKSKLIPLHR